MIAASAFSKKFKKVHFSIAKGGGEDLDRMGKASARQFHLLTEDEVLRFAEYDLCSNVLLAIGPLILSQGDKGVPIGGFISAQIAEIWAAWRESLSLSSGLVPLPSRQQCRPTCMFSSHSPPTKCHVRM